MIRLFETHAQVLHARIAEKTGGSTGVRDNGLLTSALLAPFQTFGGQELYPTLLAKAARLGHSLIANHAFVDGNKRIGVLLMLVFLEINGAKVQATNQDIIAVGLGVADGSMDYNALLAWLTAHTAL